jgi:hypothetical protein
MQEKIELIACMLKHSEDVETEFRWLLSNMSIEFINGLYEKAKEWEELDNE